jgi:hypothetical protein
MFKKSLVIAALFAAVPKDIQAATAGFGGSVTLDGAQMAKNIVTPIVFQNLQDLTIPEVDFDGGWLKNVKVAIP